MNVWPSRLRRSSERLAAAGIDALRNPPHDLVGGDTVLLQGIPVTDSDSRILQRLSVNSHAEGSSDLVLAAVPPADGAGLVIENRKALPHLVRQLGGELRHAVLLHEREDARFDRREGGLQLDD